MKVLIVNDWFPWDCRSGLEIHIDGEKVFDVSDGEPEDSNLSRDFIDCHNIADMLKAAHAAGRAGEPFEITTEERKDGEKVEE
jgi:hypothetical protein